MSDRPTLRIANAQAFWGDSPSAAAELLDREPRLDYVTLDYLAEVSCSILARQKEKDSESGYAKDFLEVVASLVPYWKSGGRARVVTNAGGLNPETCARACREILKQAGIADFKIAVLDGDDVLDRLREAADTGDKTRYRNADTQEPIVGLAGRLVSANAYLGAAEIAAALHKGARLVITGRVADPSLTVAPCLAHFGWAENDFNELAGATIAGHLIECGTQVTGGIATHWMELPHPEAMGFPIAEISNDGSCVITKAKGTGGEVSLRTVKEQLLYEMGDPGAYLSPDVTVSLLEVELRQSGQHRVQVRGARGEAPPPCYKVSAAYRDGFKAHAQLTVFGENAVAKARRAGEAVLRRLRNRGVHFHRTLIECIGAGACAPGVDLTPAEPENQATETVLRVSVADASLTLVEQFCREVASLITAGPPGVTGYAGGRPKPQPVFAYWPCLIRRKEVNPRWRMLE